MRLGYLVTALFAPTVVVSNLQPLPHDVRPRLHAQGKHVERQILNPTINPPSSADPVSTSDVPTPSSTSSPTSSSTSTSSTSSSTPSKTSSSAASTPTSSPSLAATSTTPSLTSSTSSTSQTAVEVTVTASQTSDSSTLSSTSSSASASPTGPPPSGGGGISTSTVIGLSVAGGLGALAIIGFIIWKLKKKRFADFDDDDGNAIRWPELDGAAAMHPLPARPTGRAGIETNALDRSETDFDGRSLADSSTADLAVHAAPAPYSLPAPEPPQQYYDDPAGGVYPHSGAYYDPYRGPVPPTMSPTTPNQGRPDDLYQARSPGPNGGGRAISPGPQTAYIPTGRTPSPGPGQLYATRSPSPGPNMAFGGARSASPGVHAAYGGQGMGEGHQ